MSAEGIYPENWKEIIQGKKVILYNTGVSGLLHGREMQIEKMRWVFQIFREHPEIVLWWRPHPLSLSTLRSMAPELQEQYQSMCQDYIEEVVGILDESADLNRAIAISDAYYGDCSSVTALYQAAKKPVLFENNNIKVMDDTEFLPITVCIKEKDIWFMQFHSNKLVRVDKSTYEVKKIVSLPGEPPFKCRPYNYHLIDRGDSLWVLMEKSRRIYEYEMEADTIKTHTFENGDFRFHSEIVIEKEDQFLMLPHGSSDILAYDCHSNSLEKRKFGKDKIRAAKCYGADGTKIYVTDYDSNVLHRYDFSDQSCTAIKIGGKDNRYWGVKKAGRYLVLLQLFEREIILWDEETGEMSKLTDFPKEYACLRGFSYLNMFEKNNKIYIFPIYSNMILKVDVEKKVIEQAFKEIYYDTSYDENSEHFMNATYLCAERSGDYVYAYAVYKKSWDVFDLETETIRSRTDFKIKEPEYKQTISCMQDGNVYEESFCECEKRTICTLENYIRNIQNCNMENQIRDIDRNRIGTDIYKTITGVR